MSVTVDIVASADTTVNTEAGGIRNYGVHTNLTINEGSGGLYAKGLIRFDLSSIAAGSICEAVSIKLTNNTAHTDTYYLCKISDANGNWIEGAKSGATAGAGEPCWNAKEANGSGGVTTAWAGSAGLSTAGTDYDATALYATTTTFSRNTPKILELNAAGRAVIQGWFGAATNNGLLLMRLGTYDAVVSFYSRDIATAAYRPTLSVTYEESTKSKPLYRVSRINSPFQVGRMN